MDRREQRDHLEHIGGFPPFAERIMSSASSPLRAAGIEILQINVGNRCNLRCRHCHVDAGPDRTEIMGRAVMEKCLEAAASAGISSIDVTGGAPEMNPHLGWFLESAAAPGRRLMVRSNLAILMEGDSREFIDIYARNRVEVIASLPDCGGARTDAVRGAGVFSAVIGALRLLNEKGYGSAGSGLVLSLVHNPAGAYLPARQAALESDYRKRLFEVHGISFNNLHCMTNLPVGRYLEYLVRSGNYEDYFRDLCGSYNPDALERVMCRNTLSVGWDGTLYDCDFNQALGLPVGPDAPSTIFGFDRGLLDRRGIVVRNHCYGCVAGQGSSCRGAVLS